MKTDALKTKILEHLKKNRHLSFQELEQLCHANLKKVSNGEKRLRDLRARTLDNQPNPFYQPEIGVVRNERGAITAYTWDEKTPYANLSPNVVDFLEKWGPKPKEPVKGTLW